MILEHVSSHEKDNYNLLRGNKKEHVRMERTRKAFLTDFNRSVLAEFIGTFVLVSLIIGGGCQSLLSRNTYSDSATAYISVGFAVMLAVRMTLKVSGGHLNPCVTTSMALLGNCSWKKVPFYILAQFLGSFVAAACSFFVYKGAMIKYSGGNNYTTLEIASAYTSFPKPYLSMSSALLDSGFASAILIIVIMAMNDQRNFGLPQNTAPIFYGMMITAICGSFVLNCGNPMNPARDFGPRVFLALAGWGSQVFYGPNYAWWWLPVIVPPIGGAVGAFIYLVFIQMHHPDEKKYEEIVEEEVKHEINFEYTKDSANNDNSAIRVS